MYRFKRSLSSQVSSMPKPDYPDLPTKPVDDRTIQEAFNQLRIWDRVVSGELTFKVRRTRPAPEFERSGQPDGSESQKIDIFDSDGRFLCTAHRYLRPGEGQFGGRPDPLRLVVGDHMLSRRKRPP